MLTSNDTIIKALKILANDVQSEDGVANAAILEAAMRLSEMRELVMSCADQLLHSEDGILTHSFMSTEEWLVDFLCKTGEMEEVKPYHYKWKEHVNA